MPLTRRTFALTTLAALVRTCFAPVIGTTSRAWAQALDDADGGFAGPLVGHTTSTSTDIWMYAPAGVQPQVRFAERLADGDAKTAECAEIPTDDLGLRGRAWRAVLADLQPATRYEFEVAVDGRAADERRGSFRTAPVEGRPAKFRLGVTSCMKVEKPQTSWPLFLADEPDLHLTLGDTVYADTTDPRVQWRHHLRYRQSPAFARVVRAVPTYALWDDHDFGPNNSDGTTRGKEQSLTGWNRVWLNPAAGTEQTPGAFYRFAWGDVDFFVADGRYYRSPGKAADDEHKTMLGEEQFAWLLDGLKASTAKFKIVASGSPLEHSQHDGWRIYTHARHQFFDAIRRHRIDGVVYLSGSLHQSLVWEHPESRRVG